MPEYQHTGVGTMIVNEFVDDHQIDYLTAYTRNPSVLRILGRVAGHRDILSLTPAIHMPNSTEHGGIYYHLDRYGPAGLYGADDPADKNYNNQILKSRCQLLANPNHALAVAVKLNGVKS